MTVLHPRTAVLSHLTALLAPWTPIAAPRSPGGARDDRSGAGARRDGAGRAEDQAGTRDGAHLHDRGGSHDDRARSRGGQCAGRRAGSRGGGRFRLTGRGAHRTAHGAGSAGRGRVAGLRGRVAGLRAAGGSAPARGAQRARAGVGALGAYLRGDRAPAQLVRFAMVGMASNVVYVALFLALLGSGSLPANMVGSVASTVVANELHRRLTFRAADRVGWFTAQWEGGGLAAAGLLITSAGLAALEVASPGLGGVAQAAAVLAITAAVGTLRFLALRGWVF